MAKTYKVLLTRHAQGDLAEIYDYQSESEPTTDILLQGEHIGTVNEADLHFFSPFAVGIGKPTGGDQQRPTEKSPGPVGEGVDFIECLYGFCAGRSFP